VNEERTGSELGGLGSEEGVVNASRSGEDESAVSRESGST